jgi:hypothetical protein
LAGDTIQVNLKSRLILKQYVLKKQKSFGIKFIFYMAGMNACNRRLETAKHAAVKCLQERLKGISSIWQPFFLS